MGGTGGGGGRWAGRARDNGEGRWAGQVGQGSRQDWVMVTLETPGHRMSASGQLDSGPPSWARGPGCCPAVATWTVPGRAQVHLWLEPPGSKLQFFEF